MHIEILVEDSSGKELLNILMPKILDATQHSWRIHGYKGKGSIPADIYARASPRDATILGNLPSILRAFGKTAGIDAVIVVVDTDLLDCVAFLRELKAVVLKIDPAPTTIFRLAIEEIEAWLFGDRQAILKAYPRAKKKYLDDYVQDNVCGTWELLVRATHPTEKYPIDWTKAGGIKHEWAQAIGSAMNVESNNSPSFSKFRDGLRNLISLEPKY